jgi:hypothetical protein
MPSRVQKLSVSVPCEVWDRARSLLGSSDEPNSAFVTRILQAAITRELETQYARGYAEHPYTPEEEAVLEGMQQLAAKAMSEDLVGDKNDYAEWKARRSASG